MEKKNKAKKKKVVLKLTRFLRMRIMVGFTVDAHLPVLASLPLIGGGLMALRAQGVIWRDRHLGLGMVGLEGPVARLTGHACFDILPSVGIVAGCVTFKP